MSDVLEALDRNETVTILYRGKEKAMLVPAGGRKSARAPVASHPAFGMWADRDDLADVAASVRRIREGRVRAV